MTFSIRPESVIVFLGLRCKSILMSPTRPKYTVSVSRSRKNSDIARRAQVEYISIQVRKNRIKCYFESTMWYQDRTDTKLYLHVYLCSWYCWENSWSDDDVAYQIALPGTVGSASERPSTWNYQTRVFRDYYCGSCQSWNLIVAVLRRVARL